MNDKIKDLQRQIEDEKRKISKCKHIFGTPFSNPDKKMEAYGYKMVAQGSDVWHEPQGYKEVSVPRWTRICSECGYEEHTNKTEPIITGNKPKF